MSQAELPSSVLKLQFSLTRQNNELRFMIGLTQQACELARLTY
jgi:hypothetical protein